LASQENLFAESFVKVLLKGSKDIHHWRSKFPDTSEVMFNILNPTGYVMHQQFNFQQLYALPTQYLCVLYLSENKQRLVPLTA
jgi:hypothetical protein